MLAYPQKDTVRHVILLEYPAVQVVYSGKHFEVGRLWMVEPAEQREHLIERLRKLGCSFRLLPDNTLMTAHLVHAGDFSPDMVEDF